MIKNFQELTNAEEEIKAVADELRKRFPGIDLTTTLEESSDGSYSAQHEWTSDNPSQEEFDAALDAILDELNGD